MHDGPPKTGFPRTIAAIIVAAGRGQRAGKDDGPKQYRRIGGKAVIALALQQALSQQRIDWIVVAIHADDRSLFHDAVGSIDDRVTTVIGGETRQDSVRIALESLPESPDAVLIHDAARPFADASVWQRVINAIGEQQASCPAIPLADTVKRIDANDFIVETPDRRALFGAQTPQGFPYSPILAAHREAQRIGKFDFTDDASLAEWAGLPVKLVQGSPENVKLTWAKDIEMANLRAGSGLGFPDVRTGNGYDVHAFEPGSQVILCGVSIPHHRRLSGHSDADVALHALTDALLATCGAGDIGSHFPPSDPQWRGAASRIFVEHAVETVRIHGGRIANADITLICEAPKIGPHRDRMTANLASMLGIAKQRLSVKATTNERLGFIGREEGIAAIATATVVFPGSLPE